MSNPLCLTGSASPPGGRLIPKPRGEGFRG